MMKTLFLKIRNALTRKNTATKRQNLPYEAVKEIGLLIHNPDSASNDSINSFVKNLIQDGKKVEVLCFVSKKNPIKYDFPCSYLSFKDIDWKGDFKGALINKFTKTEFDYLYSINILPFLPFEILLKKSKAKFRIGKYHENSNLDLMIRLNNDRDLGALLEQMILYSKKL